MAKNNPELMALISERDFDDGRVKVFGLKPVGSFASIRDANRYTSDVLAKNADKVADVASGRVKEAFLKERYSSPTGREIFRKPGLFGNIQTLFRPTFFVGVSITHDQSRRGWRLKSTYPMNRDPNDD